MCVCVCVCVLWLFMVVVVIYEDLFSLPKTMRRPVSINLTSNNLLYHHVNHNTTQLAQGSDKISVDLLRPFSIPGWSQNFERFFKRSNRFLQKIQAQHSLPISLMTFLILSYFLILLFCTYSLKVSYNQQI